MPFSFPPAKEHLAVYGQPTAVTGQMLLGRRQMPAVATQIPALATERRQLTANCSWLGANCLQCPAVRRWRRVRRCQLSAASLAAVLCVKSCGHFEQ